MTINRLRHPIPRAVQSVQWQVQRSGAPNEKCFHAPFARHRRICSSTSTNNHKSSEDFTPENNAPRQTKPKVQALEAQDVYTSSAELPYGGLPLPPFMDTKVKTARSKYKQPKPAPVKSSMTDFRQRIRDSAYAQALATPLRSCFLSDAKLPKFFHLTLHPKNHPETGDVWMLPVDQAEELNPKKHRKYDQPARFLNSRRVVEDMTYAHRKVPWEQALTQDMIQRLSRALEKRRVVWREDMPSFLLSLMRQSALKALRGVFTRKNQPDSWLEIVDDPSCPSSSGVVACAFYLGPNPNSSAVSTAVVRLHQSYSQVDRITTSLHSALSKAWRAHKSLQQVVPGEPPLEYYGFGKLQLSFKYPPYNYSTIVNADKTIPVYPLEKLLGPTYLAELRKGTRYEQSTWVLMKERRYTQASHIRLMKLEGYLQSWP